MSRFDELVSDLCSEIDHLEQQLKDARAKERYWREQYNEMLNGNIRHSNEMAGNMLKIFLTPGVSDAFIANANAEEFSA